LISRLLSACSQASTSITSLRNKSRDVVTALSRGKGLSNSLSNALEDVDAVIQDCCRIIYWRPIIEAGNVLACENILMDHIASIVQDWILYIGYRSILRKLIDKFEVAEYFRGLLEFSTRHQQLYSDGGGNISKSLSSNSVWIALFLNLPQLIPSVDSLNSFDGIQCNSLLADTLGLLLLYKRYLCSGFSASVTMIGLNYLNCVGVKARDVSNALSSSIQIIYKYVDIILQ
jgi:hypothetical protein